MKVVQVEYKGKTRNVFLYDGMSSQEVSTLLTACVNEAHGSSTKPPPRILAIRDPVSGTVVPLSLALKHLPSLWSHFQLIDEQQATTTAPTNGPSKNINTTKNSNYSNGSTVTALRPSSSPATAFATNPSSVAGLPTPIPRHTMSTEPPQWRGPNQYQARAASAASASPLSSAYSSPNSSPQRPARVNNYVSGGGRYNFTGDSSPEYSPRFQAVASPTSSIASSSIGGWNEERNTGVHVVLSYPELLNIFTGHLPANINNGPSPSAETAEHFMFALAIVEPGSEDCEEMFLTYQAFANSSAFNNIIFLIIEATLLKGTSLEVNISQLPAFQFFLKGHLLGQLNRPTFKQLEEILKNTNRLVHDHPNLQIEDGEEVSESELDESDNYLDSDEEREAQSQAADWRREAQLAAQSEATQRARAQVQQRQQQQQQQRGRQGSQSLGEALDDSYALNESERREIFANAADEEARWSQLLQASPKSSPARGPKRSVWKRSPDPSDSEGDEAGPSYTAPPSSGLVIRGQKVKLYPATQQPQVAQQRSATTATQRSQPPQQRGPSGRLQDWNSYEKFDGSDSVDESDYGGSDNEPYSPSDSAPEESDGERYEQQARQEFARRQQQQQQQQQAAQARAKAHHDQSPNRKRKTNPIASSDEDDEEGSEADGVGVADGGSDYSQALSLSPRDSRFSSANASPQVRGRQEPATSSSSMANTGIVMSASQARAIERIILRQDADVKNAFRTCPDLDELMEVFVNLVQFQLANPLPQEQKSTTPPFSLAGPSASSTTTSPTKNNKRKAHPVETLVGEEPKHKRLLQESAIIAKAAAQAARARHKRLNQQVYEEEARLERQRSNESAASSRSRPERSDEDDEEEEKETRASLSAREQVALEHLKAQQEKYAYLQQQYLSIQNEIFSKTVHDLSSQNIISQEELGYLVHLWCETEVGSDAIRQQIKQYETDGDELGFMRALVMMAKRFGAGLSIGDESSPTPSEGSENEEDERAESPLPSDEERQYQALLRQFEREQALASSGSSVSASPTGSEGSSLQGSSQRPPPRSSTKAPRPSPASGAPPTNKAEAEALQESEEESEEELAHNLDLVEKLVQSELLTPADGRLAQQYLVHGHPLLQAAFGAFAYNSDVDDLVDTIEKVLSLNKPAAANQPKQSNASSSTSSSTMQPTLTSLPTPTLTDASQLLSIMPPWIVSSHRSALEELVRNQDVVLLAAWDVLQAAVSEHRQSQELALDVEEFIDTIMRRLEIDSEQPVAQPEPTQQSSEPSADSIDSSIADALQVTSVLHTGRVFDDEETAVLWSLILNQNPVISAAFDLAREDSQYDELHDTLIRIIAKNVHLKSSLHPLLPLVRKATGVMSAADVSKMQELVKNAPINNSNSAPSATPSRARNQPLPPPATPISPSIPQSGWSKIVRAFTSAIESMQRAGSLSDASALKLIDLFQARNPGIVAAAEVLELDGNQAEFEDTLRVIVSEEEEKALKSPRSQSATQTQSQPPRSFAERVQAPETNESRQEADEDEYEDDETNDEEQEDDDDERDSLDELLNRDENGEEWDEESTAALYDQILKMQTELTALRKARAEQGMPVDDESEDEWDALNEEEEGEDEEEEN